MRFSKPGCRGIAAWGPRQKGFLPHGNGTGKAALQDFAGGAKRYVWRLKKNWELSATIFQGRGQIKARPMDFWLVSGYTGTVAV
jgi:hypothetical protein